jgi:hypothetical protein
VFQGEQKRMRRLLVLPQVKKTARVVVDKTDRKAENRAKLLAMVS